MSSNSVFVYWNSVWQKLTYSWCFAPRFAKGFENPKIATANVSHLEPQLWIYRLLMKEKLAVYELWPFGKKLITSSTCSQLYGKRSTGVDLHQMHQIVWANYLLHPEKKGDVLGQGL